MKKLLLTMLGVLMALPAMARDFSYTYEGQTITYTVLDEEAKTVETKQGYKSGNTWYPGNNVSGNLMLPSEVFEGDIKYSVTKIGYAGFENCRNLISVIVPPSVKSIDSYAFYGCSGLIKSAYPNTLNNPFSNGVGIAYNPSMAIIEDGWIYGPEKREIRFAPYTLEGEYTIAETVWSIGPNAFRGCSGLTSVIIPNSVKTIGESVFYGCDHLTSVIIGNSVKSIGSYAFSGCSGLKKSAYPNTLNNPFSYYGTSIAYNPEGAIIEDGWIYGPEKKEIIFAPLSLEGEYTIPESVESIGSYALEDCSGLTSVIIGNSVKSIGKSAFNGCSGLTSLTLGNSVETIGAYAFYSLSNLTSLVIPNSVKTIEEYAFEGCSGLTSVIIGNSVKTIGKSAFNGCSGLTSLTLGNSVETIGAYAFYSLSNLTSLVIPNSVKTIEEYAFEGCSGLTSVIIGNSVKTIGDEAFSGCKDLTSIDLPNSVQSIGKSAFYACSGLTSVIIGNSVTSIGSNAFYGCYGLKKSAYPNTLENPFSKGTCIAYNPQGAIIEDGWIYGAEKKEIRFAPWNLEGEYTIAETVESIGPDAFYGCSGLTSVTIGNSVKTIGKSAFNGCSGLTSLTLGNSVETIGAYAFYSLSNLTSLVIPNSVKTIEEYAFNGCSGLTSLSLGNSVETIGAYAFCSLSNLTSLVTPNSVKTIGKSAFNGCSGLTSLTLGNSVETIGAYAFYSLSNLTSLVIPNSVKTIEEYAFNGCSGLTSLTLGNSVETIGTRAFTGCSRLTSVIIPPSVRSLGEYPFSRCSNLEKSAYPNTLINPFGSGTGIPYNPQGAIINDGWIYGPEKKEIRFVPWNIEGEYTTPESVESIDKYAFYGCTGLTSLIIWEPVTTIGSKAFYGCTGLNSIIIGPSVNSIAEDAFGNCTNVKRYAYPNLIENPFNSGIDKSYNPEGAIYENGWIYGPDKKEIRFAPSSVTECVVPETVESIASDAFWGCTKLTSLVIPNSVKTIGESAFSGCNNLTKAEFSSIEHLCSIEFGDYEANPLYKVHNLYINGEEVTDVVIPESVTAIGNYAFYGCKGLTSVNIPNSVQSIGSSAFSGCSGLTSVSIPNSVQSIGSSAFYGCKGLTSVTIPNSVTSIGNNAFSRCSGLTSVIIGNSVQSIGSSAFYGCSGLTSVIIGNSVKTIGDEAFSGCKDLTSIDLPNSVQSIGSSAFSGCSGLTSVIIGNSVETIDWEAFHGCSGLIKSAYPNTLSDPFSKGTRVAYNPEGAIIENGWIYGPEKKEIRFAPYTLEGEYTIPESIEAIGSNAFEVCSGLTSVTIPNSVQSIGKSAFYDCSGLTSVIIGNSVKTIGNYAFYGCKELTKSAYPNTIRDPFSYGTRIAYNPQGAIIEDGWIYGAEKKEIRFAPWNLEGEYTIPESVESIGPNAFRGCSDLTSVTLGESVTSIDESAFNGCSGLTSIEVTALVPPTFSDNSFSGLYDSVIATIPHETADLYLGSLWTKFKNLHVAGSETNITSASDGTLDYYLVPAAGADDKNLAIVKPGKYSGEITIPERFTYTDSEGNNTRYYVSGIGYQAFKNSSITKVNLNSRIDLKSIGDEAFYGCAGLTEFEIPNTVEAIGNSAFQDCEKLTSVTIGNSVATIGENAFRGCSGLTSVDIPSSVATICDKAFSGCISLTSVNIPNSVETIGESAFSDCIGLNSITIGNSAETIGNSVATIGKSAFSGCDGLASAIIGNSVEIIGESAFANCWNLTSITIGNSVKSIGSKAFYDCSDLTKAEFSNIEHLCSIEFGDYEANPLYYAHHLYINGEEVKDVVIPESVTSIGKYAFYGCTGLKSVSIPNSVTSIGKDAFQDCDKLTKAEFSSIEHLCSIKFGNSWANPLGYAHNLYINGLKITDLVIPTSVETIGGYAFLNGSSLTSVTLGNSVETIGEKAFSGCTGLTSINIGNSVEAIGEKAFSGCTGLKALTFSESMNPIEIGDDAIPSSMQSLYWGRTLEDLNFSVQNLSSLSIGNFTTLIPANSFKGLTKLTTLHLGSGITEIGANAFSGCTGLTEVVVPLSVETISESAFAGNKAVTSIIMGANVKSIGDKAFDGCPVENVYITAQTPPEATNTTFSTYTAKLWLQDKGDNSVIDAYYDAFTCWDRFESSAMIAATEIKVDNNIDVVVGKPAEIKATVLPEDAALPQLFWRSSNPEVATVDCNGVVTAISESGECKIIAETLYANGPVAEINVTVKEAEAPKNPAISIEPATVELTVGKTAELTVTKTDIDDDEVVVWTSSDENVATVDAEGNVTAVGAGTATITATCAGVKAEATVIVNDDKSGINDVIAVDEKVTVYNLRGVKVGESTEGLPKGIYIVREGGATRKIAL